MSRIEGINKEQAEELEKELNQFMEDLTLGIGKDTFIIRHNLTDNQIKNIDKKVKFHKCNPKYLQVYMGDIRLRECVKCGVIITQRKRVCKLCKNTYGLVYAIEGYCNKCSENKRLGDLE